MKPVPQKILNDYAQDAGYPQEHMDAIIEAARWAKPKGILDVGMHYGSSAIHFKNAFPDAVVVTVGDEISHGNWVPGSVDVLKARLVELEMEGQIVIVKSDTRECKRLVSEAFGNVTIGFVFLDACHDFYGLMAEFEQYEHLLASKHCIVLDDTSEDGVNRFSELFWKDRGYTLTFGKTFKGLSILRKG